MSNSNLYPNPCFDDLFDDGRTHRFMQRTHTAREHLMPNIPKNVSFMQNIHQDVDIDGLDGKDINKLMDDYLTKGSEGLKFEEPMLIEKMKPFRMVDTNAAKKHSIRRNKK